MVKCQCFFQEKDLSLPCPKNLNTLSGMAVGHSKPTPIVKLARKQVSGNQMLPVNMFPTSSPRIMVTRVISGGFPFETVKARDSFWKRQEIC